MELDRVPFDQDRFERLNPEPVQRWGAVQQDRMVADDFGEDFEDFGFIAFDNPVRAFDVRSVAFGYEARDQERMI